MKTAKYILVLLVTGAFLGGCTPASSPDSDKPSSDTRSVIRFGVNEPLTGANESGGNLELQGITLAHQLYPTVLGRTIELVIQDNRSEVEQSAAVTTEMVEDSKVNAVIGSYTSSLSLAAGPIIQEAGIPTVGGSCTNALVTAGNEYYFRVCFIDPFQGTVMADYAYNHLKARSAVIVFEDSSDYSVGLAKSFSDAFVELSGKSDSILETLSYATGDRDFSQQAAKISTLKPDLVFAPGNDTESALLIKQARAANIRIPFLGGDTWETQEFLKEGGDAVEGAAFSSFYNPKAVDTALGKQFVTAYRKKYGSDPNGPSVNGFDAYMVLRDAIERAKSADPKQIRDELAKTNGFQGAGGPVQLDENRNAIKPVVIMNVDKNQFRYLETINPKQ